jgi:hypothetical protein
MVTFDYAIWDSTKESIPRRAGKPGSSSVSEPFSVEHLLFSLFSGCTPNVQDPIRTDMLKTLQANLWITIARFRQLGVSAGDLQRLFKAYPERGLSEKAAAFHKVRDTVRRFANAANQNIQLPANSRWEVRQDGTGDVWSLHPKTL